MDAELYHLVALTPDRSEVLCQRTATGWCLPSCLKNPQAELPDQVAALLKGLARTVDLVHEAPLAPTSTAATPAGASVAQFYFLASCTDPLFPQAFSTMPVVDLLSSPALIPAQRDALADAVSREHSPTAPFDTHRLVAEHLAWAAEEAASHLDAPIVSLELHRCARFEQVARVRTTAGTAYFKGGPARVEDEAETTQWLADVAPGRIPRTLAVDHHRQRWLYQELAGDLLVGSRLTMAVAHQVVVTLAELQKRALRTARMPARLAARAMDATGMWLKVDALVTDVWMAADACDDHEPTVDEGGGDGPGSLLERWRAQAAGIADACDAIDRWQIPLSVAPSDFWGRNILLGPDGVGFIDLEQCYWSAPCLPLWRFIHDVTQAVPDDDASVKRALGQSFIAAWSDLVAPEAMAHALARLPVLGRLFTMQLIAHECDRFEQELGRPLAPWYRRHRLAPYARRLLDSSSEGGRG